MLNAHIKLLEVKYSKFGANVKANGKSDACPDSVQIQAQINSKSASVNVLKTYYTLQRDSALLDYIYLFVIVIFVSFLELKVRQFCYKH